jgi:WD40 repeat protein
MSSDSQAPAPFLTLAQLRDEHTLLTARFRSQPGEPAVINAAESFIARCGATGTVLDSSAERAAAQTMLDYWATVLFRHTSKFVETTIDEFRPSGDRVLDERDCPYPGIEPFDAGRRTLFHGRQSLVAELVALLQQQDCVCLVGEAGVGKTSLVQAGLLPALADQTQETTRTLADGAIARGRRRFLPTVVPGSDPLGSLATAIFGPEAPAGLRGQASEASFFSNALDAAAPNGAVLVVDGLEELFMLCPQEELRAQFAAAIAQIASSGRNHLLVLTTRSSWVSSLATLDGLKAILERYQKQVPPLTGPAVADAVASPAARVGLTFDEGLAETIARDFLNEPLALLQLTMTALWARREGTRVRWQAYAEMGRGRALVNNQASALGLVAGSGSEPLLRTIMLAFVERRTTPGQIRTVRVDRERLLQIVDSSEASAAIDRLLEGRLLRSSVSTTGVVRYEWLHSALKDAVPLIGAWIHNQELEAAKAAEARERARADMEAGLKRKARRRAWAFAAAAVLAFMLTLVTLRQLSQREVLLLASASDRVATANPELALALGFHALERSPESPAAAGAVYKVYFEYPTRRVYPATAASNSGPIEVTAIAVTQDGRYALAGDAAGTLSVMDLESDERATLASLDPADGAISAVAVTPGGDLVMAGTAGGVIGLFDRATGAPRGRWTHHEKGKRIHSLAFSSDGRTAASASADDTVWITRRTGADFPAWHELEAGGNGHRTSVRALAFGPGTPLLFSGEEHDGRVIAWDVGSSAFVGSADLMRLGDAADTQAELRSLAVAPGSCTLLAGGTDGSLTLVDVRGAMPAAIQYVPACDRAPTVLSRASSPSGGSVTGLAFAPDGRSVVSKTQAGAATLWRAGTRGLELVKTFEAHLSPVRSVAFPNNEFFISGHDDGSVRAWSLDAALDDGHFDMATSAEGAASGKPPVASVGLSADGRSAFAASQHLNKVTVARVDLGAATVSELFTSDYTGTVPPLVDRSASRVLSGANAGLEIHSLAAAGAAPDRYRANAVAATLDGPTAAWISDGDWSLFVADPGGSGPRRVATLDPPQDDSKMLFAMAGSADGRRVAVGTQAGRVRVFDVRGGGEERAAEFVQRGAVTALAFHPDGRRLASASADGMITLWNLAGRGQELGKLRGHTSQVNALAFSPDGVLLLSAATGAQGLLLWHVDSRLIVHVFPDQTNILSAAISSDGGRAVTGSSDGVVTIWRLPRLDRRDLLNAVREKRSVRPLSPDERAEFGLTAWFESLHNALDVLHLERWLP